jgi:hypothetical protein
LKSDEMHSLEYEEKNQELREDGRESQKGKVGEKKEEAEKSSGRRTDDW